LGGARAGNGLAEGGVAVVDIFGAAPAAQRVGILPPASSSQQNGPGQYFPTAAGFAGEQIIKNCCARSQFKKGG
jgi:hypothetical protein